MKINFKKNIKEFNTIIENFNNEFIKKKTFVENLSRQRFFSMTILNLSKSSRNVSRKYSTHLCLQMKKRCLFRNKLIKWKINYLQTFITSKQKRSRWSMWKIEWKKRRETFKLLYARKFFLFFSIERRNARDFGKNFDDFNIKFTAINEFRILRIKNKKFHFFEKSLDESFLILFITTKLLWQR